MPYEVPQNLKYEEKIAFGLTFAQMLWLGAFGGLGVLVFFKAEALAFEARAGLAILLALLGFSFAFLKLGEHAKSLWRYKNAIHEAGYLDRKASKFAGVKKVENDAIWLNNNSARAVLQVLPINFSMLSKEEQSAVISAYRDFLNSLDFPVQIVMRTVNLQLENYLQPIEKEVEKSKEPSLKEQYASFRDFVSEFIKENAVRNRLFYLVIPSSGSNANEFGALLSGLGRKADSKNNTAEQLGVRAKLCAEKLKKCGLVTKRMETNELVPLLASFFEGYIESGNDYFFPLTLLEKQEEESDAETFPKKESE